MASGPSARAPHRPRAPPKPTIVLSYARRDGAPLAHRLHHDLAAHHSDPFLDTSLHAGAAWTTDLERAIDRSIDRSAALLAILTPDSFDSAICRAEQLRALRQGKPVIPLRAHPAADIPLHLEGLNRRDFAPPADHAASFALLLAGDQAGPPVTPLPERFRTTLVTAPPLPRN